ncbi:MAG: hypothetical protein JWM07_798 [Candidatus Saccharibacteria bacterium]|nr:hypothetical protein [Candidatus Saccharibacteria bacterium]
MTRRVSLEDRPQYISNPLHKQAVDQWFSTKGKAARRTRAIDRKFQSDCERLGLEFPVYREPMVVTDEMLARMAAVSSGYNPFDQEEGSPF